MRLPWLIVPALLLPLCLPFAARAADGTLPAWLDKIKLGADFRYRHELIATETYSAAGNLRNPDRNRHRIRLRLGITYQANPDLDIVTRFATSSFSNGTGDPISTNQDLTAASAPKPFWVDRAYVDYHPLTGLAVRAGRFAMPYEGTDLVWDGDLNLEGVAISGLSKPFNGWELLGRAGGYWLQERSSGPDQGLLGAQGGVRYSGDVLSGQLAAGYYDYTNLINAPVLLGGFGNTEVNGLYRNDYDLIDLSGRLTYAQPQWDVTLVGDYVINLEADSAETGFYAGMVVKLIKLPIDWDLGYNYRDVEADATVATFNDSDSRGGGTNFNGHKVSLFFTVAKNARLGGHYLINVIDPDGQKLDYHRLQADLEVKF